MIAGRERGRDMEATMNHLALIQQRLRKAARLMQSQSANIRVSYCLV
jgi:hypothetical protein